MKRINNLLLVTLCSTLVFTTADAQRRENGNADGRSRESRQSNVSPSRGESANIRTFPSAQRPDRTYNNSSARVERNAGNRDTRNATRNFQDNRVTAANPNNSQSTNQRNIFSNRDNTGRGTRERNRDLTQSPVRNSQGTSVSPQSNSRTFDQQRNSRTFDPQRNSRTFDQQRNNRNSVASNNVYRNNRYNNYGRNSYRDRDDYRNSYYNYNRNGSGRRFYVMYGPRYSYRPHNSISLYFGGFPYYYSSGLYYSYYSGYYQPVFPPFGIRISTLPFGYSRFYMGVDPFYYYNGIYYRQYDNSYEVVDAPMGATVSSLPTGARSVSINGEKFYELNGTYYKEDRNSKGQTVYVVVGKNGSVNNSDESNNIDNSASPLNNGDIVAELPEGSKVVTLNGEKLYVTPDNNYLREEVNGDTVQYRVVGK